MEHYGLRFLMQPTATAKSPAAAIAHEDKILLLLTLIIGALVGLVVSAFILLTENLSSRLYPGHGAAWRRLIIPFIGALATGYPLARYFPNARGSGIPQAKAALFLRDGFIAFRTVLGKFSMSAISLASGIALGREGPSVQVGCGIASVLGRKLGLTKSSVKALVPAGASAALAAAFNTPIAAVLFSLEEVMGDLHAPVLGSIVLSSATSWIVLHLLLGDEPLFHVPAYQLVNPIEFPIYAVLGIVGGFVSVGFVKLLLWQRKHFLAMPKSNEWWQPAVGGLTVGVLGWFFPNVMGVGYSYVGQALNGEMLIKTMAVLVLLKLVATATCYASGNAGGIFGPSLFLGAMTGGAVGGVAHMLFPDSTGSAGAYALVGMGTAFAGIVRTPLTSVIMIFEITRDYSIIVPLMISNLLAYFISSRLQKEPIYDALQHQDGIHLPSGARAREALLMVGQAFRPVDETLSADLPLRDVAASIDRKAGSWPVVDRQGLRGMLSLSQLDRAIKEGRGHETLGQLVPAPDHQAHLTAEEFPHVHPDHTLDIAIRRLAETGLEVLPVVSRTNLRELNGVISMQDVVAAYAVGRVSDAGTAAPGAPVRRPVLLLAGVLAVLISAAAAGGFLSYYYRAQRAGRAQRAYQQGNVYMAKDLYPEAVQQFRAALSLSHSSQYRLALSLALIKAGRLNEAGIYLKELLHSDPNSGPANLGMARVTARQGHVDEALAFYHHAIDGAWPEKAPDNRLQVRLELIGVLGKAGERRQAQAELLSLLPALPGDPALQQRVARLLLDYGLPKEASELFKEITLRNHGDEEAFAGLGEAEFARDDYVAARDAFRAALRLNRNDTTSQKRLDTCDQILALDPTRRGLRAAERRRRSHELLAQVIDAFGQCTAPSVRAMINTAHTRHTRDAESISSLAEDLWTAGISACGAPLPPDAPLSRVMSRLTAR
jgi:chloride channel protein, CIC family